MTSAIPPTPPTRSPPPSRDCADDGCRARRGRAVTGTSITGSTHGEPRLDARRPVTAARAVRRRGSRAAAHRRARAAAPARGAGRGIRPAVGERDRRRRRRGSAAGVAARAAGVEMGLVRREADPDDARRTRVALTDQGSRSCADSAASGATRSTRRSTPFTEDERAELARLLTQARGRAGRAESRAADPERVRGQKLVTRSPSTALSLVGSVAS